MLLLRVFR